MTGPVVAKAMTSAKTEPARAQPTATNMMTCPARKDWKTTRNRALLCVPVAVTDTASSPAIMPIRGFGWWQRHAVDHSTEVPAMSQHTLTDSQSWLLSLASQRDDGRLSLPDRLRGATGQKVVAALERRGLIEQILKPPEPPVFGRPTEPEVLPYVITTSGLAAIGLGPEHADGSSPDTPPPPAPTADAPRPAGKRGLVIELLQRPDGASLDDLISSTGWLPHTTRAALTRLRQQGVAVARERAGDGPSRYRIIPAAPDEVA